MFQPPPEPTAYLQLSTGYAIPHSLPEYVFDDTQVRLSDGRGSGTVDAGALLYHGTPPIFSPQAGCAGLGPAPAAPNSFDFDITTSSATTTTTTTTTTATATAAAATSTACVPPHPRTSLPLLVKMEPNTQDLAAQEAAARDYQPQLEVGNVALLAVLAGTPRSLEARDIGRDLLSERKHRARPLWRNMPRPTRSTCRKQW